MTASLRVQVPKHDGKVPPASMDIGIWDLINTSACDKLGSVWKLPAKSTRSLARCSIELIVAVALY